MVEELVSQKTPESVAGAEPPRGVARNVAEALGQVVWLLSQSPAHSQLRIRDLEWSFMPAILHEQFRIFRFGPLSQVARLDPTAIGPAAGALESFEQLPLGVAIWGSLSPAAEAKLEKGEHLASADWRSGDRVWLIELLSPFSTPTNRLSEAMLLDLVQGPFRHTVFNLHRTDPASGRRDRVTFAKHVGLQAPGRRGSPL